MDPCSELVNEIHALVKLGEHTQLSGRARALHAKRPRLNPQHLQRKVFKMAGDVR